MKGEDFIRCLDDLDDDLVREAAERRTDRGIALPELMGGLDDDLIREAAESPEFAENGGILLEQMNRLDDSLIEEAAQNRKKAENRVVKLQRKNSPAADTGSPAGTAEKAGEKANGAKVISLSSRLMKAAAVALLIGVASMTAVSQNSVSDSSGRSALGVAEDGGAVSGEEDGRRKNSDGTGNGADASGTRDLAGSPDESERTDPGEAPDDLGGESAANGQSGEAPSSAAGSAGGGSRSGSSGRSDASSSGGSRSTGGSASGTGSGSSYSRSTAGSGSSGTQSGGNGSSGNQGASNGTGRNSQSGTNGQNSSSGTNGSQHTNGSANTSSGTNSNSSAANNGNGGTNGSGTEDALVRASYNGNSYYTNATETQSWQVNGYLGKVEVSSHAGGKSETAQAYSIEGTGEDQAIAVRIGDSDKLYTYVAQEDGGSSSESGTEDPESSESEADSAQTDGSSEDGNSGGSETEESAEADTGNEEDA